MLALLLRRASDEGARHAWLLTTTAAGFFRRAGFQVAERSTAPATILSIRQAVSLCPASAILMTRAINV
jgi:arsenate reductase